MNSFIPRVDPANDVEGLLNEDIAREAGFSKPRAVQLAGSGVRKLWRMQVNPEFCERAGIPWWFARHPNALEFEDEVMDTVEQS